MPSRRNPEEVLQEIRNFIQLQIHRRAIIGHMEVDFYQTQMEIINMARLYIPNMVSCVQRAVHSLNVQLLRRPIHILETFSIVHISKTPSAIIPLVDFPSVWPEDWAFYRVTVRGKRKLECGVCLQHRWSSEWMWAHVARSHTRKRAQCPGCHSLYANPNTMRKHLEANRCHLVAMPLMDKVR